jgi:antitoxin ChpS
MHTTNLRKVGGSVMLAVPPALLNILQLRPGASVGIAIESGCLVVEPQTRRRYTLDELLAQCDPKAGRPKLASKQNSNRNSTPSSKRRSKEERKWLNSQPIGRELL